MGKNNPAPAAPEQGEAEIPLTLDEFCIRLSASDARVELIGGFHHTEAVAGRSKDVESAFRARFDEFVNQPA
jgi:hypothetical protein